MAVAVAVSLRLLWIGVAMWRRVLDTDVAGGAVNHYCIRTRRYRWFTQL